MVQAAVTHDRHAAAAASLTEKSKVAPVSLFAFGAAAVSAAVDAPAAAPAPAAAAPARPHEFVDATKMGVKYLSEPDFGTTKFSLLDRLVAIVAPHVGKLAERPIIPDYLPVTGVVREQFGCLREIDDSAHAAAAAKKKQKKKAAAAESEMDFPRQHER